MAAARQTKMRLVSRPYARRTGLIPMGIAVVIGWIFMGFWLFTAVWLMRYNFWWGLVLLGSTVTFSTYLGFVTFNMIADSYKDYVLEVNDTEAVLYVRDRLRHQKATQMVLLQDVKYAEYFPSPDTATLILHAPYIDMEVPLWPMGDRGRDVVDFLDGKGVKVVNLQMDDKLPD